MHSPEEGTKDSIDKRVTSDYAALQSIEVNELRDDFGTTPTKIERPATQVDSLEQIREQVRSADRASIPLVTEKQLDDNRLFSDKAYSSFKGNYAITRESRSVVVKNYAGKNEWGKELFRVRDAETGEESLQQSLYFLSVPEGVVPGSDEMKSYAAREAERNRISMEQAQKIDTRAKEVQADRLDTERLIEVRGKTLGERLRHPIQTFKIQTTRFSRFLRGR